MSVAISAALILALAPLSRAQQSPAAAAPAVQVSTSSADAPMGSLTKEERLKLAADLLQQLSDADYLKTAPAEGKPFRASRAEAISVVYGTLAAVEYQKALKTGPDAEAKPRVEAALQARLKDADALAVNPDTLEEAGWWSSFSDYVNRDDYRSNFRGAAVAAVRGGREIDTEAERKAVKLKKSIQDAEKRLAEPGLPPAEQAAAHFKQGRLYDELADCGLGKALAETDLSTLTGKLEELADLLQRISDEDYLAVAAKHSAGQAGAFRLMRPTRAESIAAVYGALAVVEYYQSLKAGPEAEERPEVSSALQASAKAELGVDPAGLSETGYWSNVWQGLNQGSSEGYSGYRGAAVAAVRGGRSIDTEAERAAVKLKKSLQESSFKIDRPGSPRTRPSAWHYRRGRIYHQLASCGLGKSEAEAPKAQAVQEPARPEPAVDEVKAGTVEMDRMGKGMQDEIDKWRQQNGQPSH